MSNLSSTRQSMKESIGHQTIDARDARPRFGSTMTRDGKVNWVMRDRMASVKAASVPDTFALGFDGVWPENWKYLNLIWLVTLRVKTRQNELTRCRESWIHSGSC